jgi:hypothetical protein
MVRQYQLFGGCHGVNKSKAHWFLPIPSHKKILQNRKQVADESGGLPVILLGPSGGQSYSYKVTPLRN